MQRGCRPPMGPPTPPQCLPRWQRNKLHAPSLEPSLAPPALALAAPKRVGLRRRRHQSGATRQMTPRARQAVTAPRPLVGSKQPSSGGNALSSTEKCDNGQRSPRLLAAWRRPPRLFLLERGACRPSRLPLRKDSGGCTTWPATPGGMRKQSAERQDHPAAAPRGPTTTTAERRKCVMIQRPPSPIHSQLHNDREGARARAGARVCAEASAPAA